MFSDLGEGVDRQGWQGGEVRVVEAAGGVGGVAARDREHRVRRLDQSELSIMASC